MRYKVSVPATGTFKDFKSAVAMQTGGDAKYVLMRVSCSLASDKETIVRLGCSLVALSG